MKKLDVRGRGCPEPVLMTKKAIEDGEKNIEIMVDDATARNNVERFLKNNGFKVTIKEEEEDVYLLRGCR